MRGISWLTEETVSFISTISLHGVSYGWSSEFVTWKQKRAVDTVRSISALHCCWQYLTADEMKLARYCVVSGWGVGDLERNSAIVVATFHCISGQTRIGSHLCDTIVCGRSGCAVSELCSCGLVHVPSYGRASDIELNFIHFNVHFPYFQVLQLPKQRFAISRNARTRTASSFLSVYLPRLNRKPLWLSTACFHFPKLLWLCPFLSLLSVLPLWSCPVTQVACPLLSVCLWLVC